VKRLDAVNILEAYITAIHLSKGYEKEMETLGKVNSPQVLSGRSEKGNNAI